LTGVDLTPLDAIGPYGALRLLAEIGTDMSRWPTEKHFTSWLTLAPQQNLRDPPPLAILGRGILSAGHSLERHETTKEQPKTTRGDRTRTPRDRNPRTAQDATPLIPPARTRSMSQAPEVSGLR
jgi:hypothetical protein